MFTTWHLHDDSFLFNADVGAINFPVTTPLTLSASNGKDLMQDPSWCTHMDQTALFIRSDHSDIHKSRCSHNLTMWFLKGLVLQFLGWPLLQKICRFLKNGMFMWELKTSHAKTCWYKTTQNCCRKDISNHCCHFLQTWMENLMCLANHVTLGLH